MDRTKLGRDFYELGLRLGGLGTVLIGSGGGSLARALARTAGCGAALAGGEVRFHDGGCAACGVWLAEYYDIPAALFIRQQGAEVAWTLLDGRGSPLSPADPDCPAPACTGEWDLLAGADCAWAARRAGGFRGERGPASSAGPVALTLALERLGYEAADRPIPGAPRFEADPEGFTLQVTEGGVTWSPPGPDALAALAHYASQPRAVPAFRTGEDGIGQS